jgi:ubiquinone/menaquinone biosynthesis C-methylase UbiE
MLSLDIGCSKTKRGNIGVDIKKQVNIDVQANAEQLPFQTEVFDLCSIFMCIEHVDFPKQVLQEIKRVLKTNGKVYGSVPLHSKMTFFQLKQILLFRLNFAYNIHKCLKSGDHKWQFSIEGTKQLLRNVGLKGDVWLYRKFPYLDGEIHFIAYKKEEVIL